MYSRIDLNPRKLNQYLKIRHPWIFSRAIIKREKTETELAGQLVSVFCDNTFVGHGYFNPRSQIAIRLLTTKKEDMIDEAWFSKKIAAALELRQKYLLSKETTACRLVFAESDGLPGLIIDKYNDGLVIQISTLGMANLENIWLPAVKTVLQPTWVLEKSSGQSRRHEGLSEDKTKLLFGKMAKSETIIENGLKFKVDFATGQKTGFFLDQRDNRQRVQELVAGKKVLNVCAYTGSFSVYALKGGAKFVQSVDISEDAVKLTKENLLLNKCDSNAHQETLADAFDFLKRVKPREYEAIILDPPAFVKSFKNIKTGLKGYISLNSLALRALPVGGLLFTSSCSAAVDMPTFAKVMTWAALDSGSSVQILEKHGHPLDHPLLPNFPEAEYLKFFVVRKMA